MMRDYGGDVELSVNEFDTELDVVLVIQADHHSGLVETRFVFSADLDLRLELAAVYSVEEWPVVNRESIVGNAPEIGLGRDLHLQDTVPDGIILRFVEPLHLLERLRICLQ